ncbi:MAG: hypothetical protein HOG95_00265 [Rhodospirillaceae bacterium]|nr:hypothetical protein [Rhodospirillaceae bacterium]
MAKITTARAITQCLIEKGVDTAFGIPGVQLDEMFNALYETRDEIRLINPRHEQASAYMAMGYAQSTGKVGTCLAVPGPGVLNTSAALATAYGNNAPVLCLAGQIPSKLIDKGFGILHEIKDQPGTLSAVTKWQGRINEFAETPEVMAEAFNQLSTGRRRPVLVEASPDILAEEGESARGASTGSVPSHAIDQDAINEAAKLLGSAKNPAILVGGGAMDASAEIAVLSEMLQAPVIMSQDGLGVMDYRKPMALNMLAGAEYWLKIDVAIAIGTRFVMPMMDWGFDDDIKQIRIDIDGGQSLMPWAPDVHLVADAALATSALCDALADHNPSREDRTEEFLNLKTATDKNLGEKMQASQELNDAVRRGLPEDGFVCFDITQLGYHSWWGFPVYHPRTMIQQGYQGTLGYSFPTALGAKAANPDNPVVCVTGDGGFMFSIQELATAVQHKINVVVVVMNDNGYGNVRRYQKENYGGNFIASDLHQPDFQKLADSFGMFSCIANGPQELETAIKAGIDREEPVLIEVPVGELPSWQAMGVRRPRRGGV